MIQTIITSILWSVQWLRFAIIPSGIGIAIALLVREQYKGGTGDTIAMVIGSIAVIAGIVWATYIMRKYGNVDFDARLMATPELDDPARSVDDDDERSS